MHKKPTYITLCLALILSLILCGCAFFLPYHFMLDTGEEVTVQIATNGGYRLTDYDDYFLIRQKGSREVLAEGTFITAEEFEAYKELYREQANAFNEKPKANFPTFHGQIDGEEGTEYNHFILISDKTAVFIKSLTSQEKSDDILVYLVFDVK